MYYSIRFLNFDKNFSTILKTYLKINHHLKINNR